MYSLILTFCVLASGPDAGCRNITLQKELTAAECEAAAENLKIHSQSQSHVVILGCKERATAAKVRKG